MVHLGFDAGHGIYAGNGIPSNFDKNKTSEWYLNNRDAENTSKILLNEYEDVKITRLDDISGQRDVPLSVRSSLANKNNVDAVISFHHDAGGGSGITVFKYLKSTEGTTDALGQAIYSSLIKYTGNVGNRSQGIRRENFHMLRETKAPAILIENGFMDNAADVAKILDSNYSLLSGRAIAEAIASIYGLKKKVVVPPVVAGTTRRVIVDGTQVGAYKEASNILNETKKAIDKGAKKIEISLV